MPEDRRRIEEMERELQTLSRRQSERVRMRNELTRKRRERETDPRLDQPSNPVQEFDFRTIDMKQRDAGVNKADDKVQAAIYRITDKQSISPGELARETEDDAELRQVRKLLLANKIEDLPEPYSKFKNSLSAKYGLFSKMKN